MRHKPESRKNGKKPQKSGTADGRFEYLQPARSALGSPDRMTLRPIDTTAFTGLGITRTYELLKAGVMPSIKMGKKFLIPREALIAWINSCGKVTA